MNNATAESVAFTVPIVSGLILIVLTVGTPDLLDAIMERVRTCK